METTEKLLLSDLWETAKRAHTWTSFSPEKRADQVVREYSEQLSEDIEIIASLNGDADRYKKKYIELLKSWLHSLSNCASTMVTGGSNFNVARNDKANRSADNKYSAFSEFREKALNAIRKQYEQNKSPEQKTNELWDRIEKQIRSSAATIMGIDESTERGYSRALFVNSITGTVKTHAKNGNVEIVARCLDLITTLNDQATKPVISPKNSIWSFLEKAQDNEAAQQPENKPENQSLRFVGGLIIYNHQMDRLQIKHDEKPDRDGLTLMKKNGFKWSPSGGVWQRKLTGNATFALKQLIRNGDIVLEK